MSAAQRCPRARTGRRSAATELRLLVLVESTQCRQLFDGVLFVFVVVARISVRQIVVMSFFTLYGVA